MKVTISRPYIVDDVITTRVSLGGHTRYARTACIFLNPDVEWNTPTDPNVRHYWDIASCVKKLQGDL